MPRHPHPPLRALLEHMQHADEVWLPSVLPSGRHSWMYRAAQSLETVHVGLYVVIGLSSFLAVAAAWWAAALLAAVAMGVVGYKRWSDPAQDHGLPLEWNGWRIDMPGRTLARVGAVQEEGAQSIDTLCLAPTDMWSLGVVMGDTHTSKYMYAWRMELRHRSRGPVAVLCVVRSTSAAPVVVQDMDALVDAMAERLGMRRTGSRLAPKPRQGVAGAPYGGDTP